MGSFMDNDLNQNMPKVLMFQSGNEIDSQQLKKLRFTIQLY